MAIDRWNPFQDMLTLRDAMERMMQDTFTRPGGGMSGRGSFPLDLVENANGYVVHASLPGFKPDEVQVHVTGDTLTIRGEHREEPQTNEQNQQYLMRERHMATVYRSITLPAPIDADKAQASYEHGVLTLTLPRAQSAQPKQIPISGLQGQNTQGGVAGSAAASDQAASSHWTSSQMTSGRSTSQVTSNPATDSQGTNQAAKQDSNGAVQSGDTSRTGGMAANPVDEASEESFPASDPPSSMSAGTSP